MVNYTFNTSSQPLRILTKFNLLNKKDQNLVESIASWNEPNIFSHKVRDLAGRSIFIKPENESKEDILNQIQLIGSGGNIIYAKKRIQRLPKIISINQVSMEDVSYEIPQIIQEKEIDLEGKLKAYTPNNIPYGGLVKEESKLRKENTLEISILIKEHKLNVIVPKLVIEGEYNDLIEKNGNCLVFQGYKVPSQKRFSHQATEIFLDDRENFIEYIHNFLELQGKFIGFMHSQNYTYGEPHIDNFSYLKTKEKEYLYATDLSDVFKIPLIQHSKKYFGLSLFLTAKSTYNFLFPILKYHLNGDENKINSTLENTFKTFIEGYSKYSTISLPDNIEKLTSNITAIKIDDFLKQF